MTKAQLREFFKTHGVVIETSTGTWVRGYLDEIYNLLQDEIRKAENRAKRKKVQK